MKVETLPVLLNSSSNDINGCTKVLMGIRVNIQIFHNLPILLFEFYQYKNQYLFLRSLKDAQFLVLNQNLFF